MLAKNFAAQFKYFKYLDLLVCLPFILLPFFVTLVYRVNIFLSWEGAYRLYLGQVPYRDFGLPMGYGFWVIPTIFFKIFGPSLLTLVKAQFVINVLSLLALRGILYNLKVKPVLVTLALLVFCLSYVIYNFWPWYNHSVVVFELIGFFFLTLVLTTRNLVRRHIFIMLSGLFVFITFFTKQDVGGIALMICLALVAYLCFAEKRLSYLWTYLLTVAIAFAIPFILYAKYDFLYWFNLGQPPHSSRLSVISLLNVFLGEPLFEKLYLVLFLIGIALGFTRFMLNLSSHEYVFFLIICVGLLGQAIVTRMSSPLPTNHMTYFHAFGFVLLATLTKLTEIKNLGMFILIGCILVLSYSDGFWRYIGNYLPKQKSSTEVFTPTQVWKTCDIPGFRGIMMPASTIKGLENLLNSPIGKKENLKVLNMSELTPLALTLKYVPPVNQPLWYHLNIGIFDKEVDELCARVRQQEYDLVLFEDIPSLNNFYPYRIRDELYKFYEVQDTFLAPRKLEDSTIEVFIRKRE